MRFYGDIQRIDADDRMVWGYACTTERAADGLTVTLDAMRAALGPFMKFANIRAMHQPIAAGTVKEAKVDDVGIYAGAKIVDDNEWKKVEQGVYRGYSIGAKILSRDPDDSSVVTGLNIIEISLVDRPADPGAVFDVWRAEQEEEPAMAEQEAAAAEEIQRSENAMKDGSFAIDTADDIAGAVEAFGAVKNKAATKRHIIRRAGALGALDKLPEGWAPAEQADDIAETLDRVDDAATAIEKAVEALKPAPGIRVHPGNEVNRGLYTVARLGEILSQLSYVLWDAQIEADIEADGSGVPAQLRDALKALAAAYKSMSDEELTEFLAANEAPASVIIENADTDTDIKRAAAPAAEPDELARLNATVDTLTADRELLMRKLDEHSERFVALAGQLEAIRTATVAPPKTVTVARAISKEEDSAGGQTPAPVDLSEDDVRRALDAMPEVDRALLLTQAALRRPIPIR